MLLVFQGVQAGKANTGDPTSDPAASFLRNALEPAHHARSRRSCRSTISLAAERVRVSAVLQQTLIATLSAAGEDCAVLLGMAASVD